MGVLDTVTIGRLHLERFESVLPPDRYDAVRSASERARQLLEGRVVWNVNSTARGGGVAEMLISLLAYAQGATSSFPRWGLRSHRRAAGARRSSITCMSRSRTRAHSAR